MKKLSFVLMSALAVSPAAFAADAAEQYMIDNGYLSGPVQQSVVIHTRALPAADAAEAYLVENGFLSPRREVVGYSAYTQVVPEYRSAAEELLAEWGFIHKLNGTVSHIVMEAPKADSSGDHS